MLSSRIGVELKSVQAELLWYLCLAAGVGVLAYLARDLEWRTLWRYREFLLRGLGTTLMLTVLSVGLGMIVAVALASARLYGPQWLRYVATATIEIVRAVPQLLILLWVFFVLPELTGKTFTPELSAVLAFTVIAAAYLAEVIRGGTHVRGPNSVRERVRDGAVESRDIRVDRSTAGDSQHAARIAGDVDHVIQDDDAGLCHRGRRVLPRSNDRECPGADSLHHLCNASDRLLRLLLRHFHDRASYGSEVRVAKCVDSTTDQIVVGGARAVSPFH
jgi:His/Glu/Gln/Arg/opine family amino acid ABC transporter permease subunit